MNNKSKWLKKQNKDLEKSVERRGQCGVTPDFIKKAKEYEEKHKRLLNIDLSETEAKIILESLINEEKRLRKLCADANNEDIASDYTNDLAALILVMKQFKNKAVKVFGKYVLNFSRKKL